MEVPGDESGVVLRMMNTVSIPTLPKCPTGISGLDDITEGGLPRGRPTLVCGAAGSGKTLLAMEFIIRGVTEFDEPGAVMSFEETAEELAVNVESLGFDVPELIQQGRMAIDYVRVERSEIEETGEYDLEGLFVRLDAMIRAVGAKRVVLDTIEALFAGLPNQAILRAELRRLLRWLKDRGVTTVITGEQGEHALTRHNLEEYVSDCVIFLDHRVAGQIATRRLRIVKYRGSRHGTNEYPTLIDERGLSVLPLSTVGLDYPVSSERVSTGVPQLDTMLDGDGYYRGSSVLVSGTAGTGKSSLAAAFTDATCRRGEQCMYFSFEESPDQILRNMRSIGYDLEPWVKRGLLQFTCVRPSLYGLEMHLAMIHKLVRINRPTVVVMDPITNLMTIGESSEVRAMLTRVIDFFKSQSITALFTSLTTGGEDLEQTEVGISSLMDSWLLLRMIESNGARDRLLYVLKSRGMGHSNEMREFQLSSDGIALIEPYVGLGTVLTGSARLAQETKDELQELAKRQETERRQRELQTEQDSLAAQIETLKTRLSSVQQELSSVREDDRQRLELARLRRES